MGKFKKRLSEYQTKTGQIIIENLEINITNENSKSDYKNKKDKIKRKSKKKIKHFIYYVITYILYMFISENMNI